MPHESQGIRAAHGSDNAGATISTLYGERTVRVFPVLETELSTISYMNALSTVCFSLAGYFFDKTLSLEPVNIHYCSPFFIISACLCIIGICSISIRFHAIHKIKKQTINTVNI